LGSSVSTIYLELEYIPERGEGRMKDNGEGSEFKYDIADSLE
jgi:hypothetical protein